MFQFPIGVIVFDEHELISFVSQGLTLSTASLVQSFLAPSGAQGVTIFVWLFVQTSVQP